MPCMDPFHTECVLTLSIAASSLGSRGFWRLGLDPMSRTEPFYVFNVLKQLLQLSGGTLCRCEAPEMFFSGRNSISNTHFSFKKKQDLNC